MNCNIKCDRLILSRKGEAIMIMRGANYSLEGEVLYDLTTDPREEFNLAPRAFIATNEDHLRILNELREKSMAIRATSLRSKGPTTWPPRLRFYPSSLGCWLPLDSPLYQTFKCLDKEPFIPQAWLDDPDL